ncbi:MULTISPECIES: AraC family transcriptional regulator [Pseudomonas]|uniref:AraC family transcriptional regulator n=1 Tax=Pseudomonas piscis TaxID=2614538 RepID=A0A7X1U789_9PSED|nr:MULTISPECIES: AraC family transcriptional regulator [Pseudomonas]AZC19381.1 transcriptional regulator, AraC family [Pseudomonas sp. CMR5c]MCU7647391.1 AraC family transcriptional regulator [Pseudomonas piscis]MQA56806.1 helix-turn-helix domain-containing protein [Pseudomonas piscis]POA53720.1 AraC family transcriptional regulator [Pseudomonas sp. FW507-12TSA]WMN15661.1 AraC family transcriptional regulator [Pseudomonas piscis]
MHRMTSASFRVLADVMREGGANVDALLRQFGSSPQDVDENPKGVRLELVYQMMGEACRRTGNPDLGLLAYDKAHPANLKALGYAVMSCATLGTALQRLVDYHALISNGFCMCLERKPQAMQLIGFDVTAEPSSIPRAVIDAGAAQTLGLLHWLLPQHKPRPLAAAFTYAEPADTRALRRLLGDNLQFCAPHNSLTFSSQDCAIELPSADPALDVLHTEYARTRLNVLLSGSMTARVRRALSECLARGAPSDLPHIAEMVGVSARGLQRRLGHEDVHFSALQDEARLMLAHSFLRNSMRSVKYIGALLGFRDQSSFHKACIRWFGMTPGRYREQ